MSVQVAKVASFLGFLKNLRTRGDRAAMAALRRCLAVDVDEMGNLRALRYLGPFLQGEGLERQRAYWLVAGLYSVHPTDPDERAEALPVALGRLYRERGQQAIERRFLALLESDADQLAARLRRVVGIVQSEDIKLDYESLLRDLLGWFAPERRVQLRWAREFYGQALHERQEVSS